MIEMIRKWWRSFQFCSALKQGNSRLAEKLLREIQKSGSKLSWLEKLYRDKRQAEQSLREQQRELSTLKRKLAAVKPPAASSFQEVFDLFDSSTLIPDTNFIEYIYKSFKLVERDEGLLQCTGIDARTFDEFEASLVGFLESEYNRLRKKSNFDTLLKEAVDDLNGLKKGKDPEYRFELSSHVYLTRYFLENVYCSSLAWFLVYQSGLLPTPINILDIAAGPGTVIYGLALLLQSSSGFFATPPMHISYYSLELQKDLQYRGLQFWRKYMEKKDINAYFRFNTTSFFNYDSQDSKIPKSFFDFITICHCFFADSEMRHQSQTIYQEIFRNCLKPQGYVLLTIQDKKLFKHYHLETGSDRLEELGVVTRFVEELGLKLVWYKYLNSIDKRKTVSGPEFAKFARENLYPQKRMKSLLHQYLGLPFDYRYTIDDYVILAQNAIIRE